MKIAVTGCNGSVGRRVVIHCLNEGHSVVGVDCTDPVLDEIAVRRATEHEAFSFVRTDLKEYDFVLKVLEGCDAVAHLAAYPQPGDYVWLVHNRYVYLPKQYSALNTHYILAMWSSRGMYSEQLQRYGIGTPSLLVDEQRITPHNTNSIAGNHSSRPSLNLQRYPRRLQQKRPKSPILSY